MNRLHLSIGGMGCGGCVKTVTGLLSRIDGVKVEKVEVGRASVLLDSARVSVDMVRKALEEDGYEVPDIHAAQA